MNEDGESDEEIVFLPMLDVSSPALKARPNDLYRAVWDELGITGRNVNIAILDTGVDDEHESLQGKFVAGVDFNNDFGPRDGSDNPDDRNGHGTHCAGIAMGTGGAEGTYKGVAPGANLIDVKIGNEFTGGSASAGRMHDAIEWCIEHRDDDWGDDDPTNDGIHVISLSYGTWQGSDGSDDTSLLVNEAVKNGLVVCASVGNDGEEGRIDSPAAADLCIAVGAIDDQDTIDRSDDVVADYSNRGPRDDDGDGDHIDELKPDVTTPGSNIMSAQWTYAGQEGQGYWSASGTSMACPQAAGIAALMIEADPGMAASEIRNIMKLTAEGRGEPYDISLSEKYNTSYGWGIADAYAAVYYVMNERMPNEVACDIEVPLEGAVLNGTFIIAGTASCGEGTIDEVQVSIDGSEWDRATGTDIWTYEWSTLTVEDGTHNISARARCGEDHSENATRQVVVRNAGGNGGPSDEDGNDGDDGGIPGFEAPIILTGAMLALAIWRRKEPPGG